jgi:hypothetical protein
VEKSRMTLIFAKTAENSFGTNVANVVESLLFTINSAQFVKPQTQTTIITQNLENNKRRSSLKVDEKHSLQQI